MGFSGRLNTACIERVNLIVRRGVAALAQRSWATSHQAPQLLAHLEWWRASSHVVRPHQSLRGALVSPRERGAKRAGRRREARTSAAPPAIPLSGTPEGGARAAQAPQAPVQTGRTIVRRAG